MRYRKTFISSKYYTMLAGGTLTSLLVAAVVMADTFIAGLMLGEHGVAGGIYGMAVGLMLAQPVSYLVSVLYVRRKYGKENYPLFIADRENAKKTLFYELEVKEDNIISVRDCLEKELKQENYSLKTINRVMLLVEETLMMISDNNPGRTVLAECSLIIGEHLTLIIKDDGKIFDMTQNDMEVSSLRSYVMSNLIGSFSVKKMHFLTLSYNRNVFEIKGEMMT